MLPLLLSYFLYVLSHESQCRHPDECELYLHCVAHKHTGRWTDLQGPTIRDTTTWQHKGCEDSGHAAVEGKLDLLKARLAFIKQHVQNAKYVKKLSCLSKF